MKKLICIIGLMTIPLTSFADSQCKTENGRKALVAEYFASGGIAPACGAQCAADFVLAQVCTLESTANCLTSEGRAQMVKEYVNAGNPVPSCGPGCAKDYILEQVCKNNNINVTGASRAHSHSAVSRITIDT